ERKRKQARLKQIDDSVTKMQTDLEQKFPAVKPGVADDQPAESLPGVGPNLAASQVARLREKLDNAEVRQKQLEDQQKRIADRGDNVETELPPVPAGYVAALDNDPDIAGINRRVALWQQQLTHHVGLNGDPNNPGIKELKRKISEAAQERERVRKERVLEFQKTQLQAVAKRLQTDGETIDDELAGLKIIREKTQTEMKEYEAKLAKILPETEVPKDFTKVDTRSRSEIITGMMNTANLLRLELSAPTRVQSFQKAAVPM